MRIAIPPATFRGVRIPETNSRGNLWHKKKISVGFFNGTEQEQNLVKTLAGSWFNSKNSEYGVPLTPTKGDCSDTFSRLEDFSKVTDIKNENSNKKDEYKECKVQVGIELEWITDLMRVRYADIRIVFSKNDICYSRLGSDALYVPKDCHTMQIGKDYTGADVLFLFGTAMGLMRSRPPLKLKEGQIADDLKKCEWSYAEAKKCVIDNWFSDYQNSIEEDPDSIMHHWISPQWTEDNFVNATATTVSKKDLKWLEYLYPITFEKSIIIMQM